MVRERDTESGVLDSIKIIPYIKNDGVPSFRDSEIMFLWEKALGEKALDYMFLDRDAVSPYEFLFMVKEDTTNLFIVLVNKEPALLILLNNISYGKAEGHFFFYNGFRGGKAVKIGRYCLNYLINIKLTETTYVYDVIIGITPVKNVFACKFLNKLGMKIIGKIPFYLYNEKTKRQEDIIYSYYCRGLL